MKKWDPTRPPTKKNKLDKFLSKYNVVSNQKNYGEISPDNRGTNEDSNDDSVRNTNNLCDNVVAETLANKGNLLYHSQLYQDALDRYVDTTDLDPDVSNYIAHAASCHLSMRQPSQAVNININADALDHKSAFAGPIQTNVSRIKTLKKDLELAYALEDFSAAIQHPDEA